CGRPAPRPGALRAGRRRRLPALLDGLGRVTTKITEGRVAPLEKLRSPCSPMKMDESGKHLTPSPSGLSRGSTPLLGAAIASEKGVDARDERERDEPFSLD